MQPSKRVKLDGAPISEAVESQQQNESSESTPLTCFAKQSAVVLIHVPPYYGSQQRLMRGLEYRLNKELLRHVPELNGILLKYENLTVLPQKNPSQLMIMDDYPHLHATVKFDCLLFNPQPGENLVGAVTNMGYDHVNVLVFNYFVGVLPKRSFLNRNFEWIPEDSCWRSTTDPDENISIGNFVVFNFSTWKRHGAGNGYLEGYFVGLHPAAPAVKSEFLSQPSQPSTPKKANGSKPTGDIATSGTAQNHTNIEQKTQPSANATQVHTETNTPGSSKNKKKKLKKKKKKKAAQKKAS